MLLFRFIRVFTVSVSVYVFYVYVVSVCLLLLQGFLVDWIPAIAFICFS